MNVADCSAGDSGIRQGGIMNGWLERPSIGDSGIRLGEINE